MKSTFKKFALAAPLLGIVAAFSAASAQTLVRGEPEPPPLQPPAGLVAPPQCLDSKGMNVQHVIVPSDAFNGRTLATSLRNAQGQPIIAVDGEGLAKTPKSFQLFALRHECAHHSMGHVDHAYESGNAFIMPIMLTPKKKEELADLSRKMEREADCAAVREMQAAGMGEKELGEIAGELGVRFAHYLPPGEREIAQASEGGAKALWLRRLQQCTIK